MQADQTLFCSTIVRFERCFIMVVKTKVIQIIPDLNLGGAETVVENLSVKLVEDGYCVYVVSLYDKHTAISERLEKKGVPVFYLGKKPGFDIRLIIRLRKLFKETKPDVIHTHLYALTYALLASIRNKIPVKVHTVHSIATKEMSKVKRMFNSFFYKYKIVTPIAVSPSVKESMINEYELGYGQVPMIYNGIDLSKCIPKINYDNVLSGDIVTIVHIGSFKEAKNHLGLIESFKIVNNIYPNTILKLIGTGKLEDTIKNRVKELGLDDNVVFLGLKTNVYPYLYEADIFVLPSLWEGMPITLIEAMSTGLPIVATSVGGIPDIIKNNITGLLVNVDNVEIANAIIKLINNRKLRERLGRAAMVASERFSARNMTSEYERLYESRKNNA